MMNLVEFRSVLKILSRRHFIPDKLALKIAFYAYLGMHIDFDNPKTFNEKLQWLKLYDRNEKYIDLVDKVNVKDWAAERIGSNHIARTYAVWDTPADISIGELPDKFVLKTNHDSGGVVICNNKALFDLDFAKAKLNRSYSRNYFWAGREWPYKGVRPRVFAETLLQNQEHAELLDYKFMCFNGKVKCIFTCTGRSAGDLRVDFFDSDWTHLPFTRHYLNADVTPKAPKFLNKLIAAAEELSKGIPFVRVDFYEVDDHWFFGEMTFYPGSGFEEFTPIDWDYRLGSWLELPK